MNPAITDKFSRFESEIVNCHKCPRLVAWREEVARVKRKTYRDWEYWGKPVPGFGDNQARVLIVGLAPGAHGSNRTGRMFTGDASGEILYRHLYQQGFANQPRSENQQDGLSLSGAFISAVCRCVPPDNKPTRQEEDNCRPYLETEFELLHNLQGIVVLGRIAYDGVVKMFSGRGIVLPKNEFGHGNFIQASRDLWILQSYHPSRQNTQTGRLTEEMFSQIWKKTRELIDR